VPYAEQNQVPANSRRGAKLERHITSSDQLFVNVIKPVRGVWQQLGHPENILRDFPYTNRLEANSEGSRI
jgi:hypothetical protein